jgi:activator of HSP90 ATPase
MSDSFQISTLFTAEPERIYQAWMSSQGHTAMTGSPATVDPKVGGEFTAGEGYISGKTLELETPRRILQAWRTSEFPEGSPDSRLEVLLEGVAEGTKLTLIHTEIPDGQGEDYKQGWQEFYFTPMREYFSKQIK